MPLPLVAIVGRPNVGKSTVFNRMLGRREAIVHDEPGVTRDRHYAEVFSRGRTFTVVDTGGFDPDSDDPMRQGIARQVRVAIEEADVVVCVLDAAAGPTDADRQAVDLLRRSRRPVVYAANKADSERQTHDAADLYRLGVDEIVAVSALHGRGFGELEEAVVSRLPPGAPEQEPCAGSGERAEAEAQPAPVRVAIVGRPNAGKSSLVNRLVGADRMLVDSRPGTTRDPVDAMVERGGHRYLLVDTAGIRRKSRTSKLGDAVEVVSVLRALRAMGGCEVAVLLCDATAGVAEQDARILGLAVERGRAAVVALNKIDAVEPSRWRKLEQEARDKLSFAPWVPIVRTSAVTGRGVAALLETVIRVREGFGARVPTAELNRFFEQVIATHPPPTMGGRAPRLYFITQAETSPPLFVVMSSAPDAVHFSYQRYVANQIRDRFGFEGVPVRVAYRARRKRERRAGS
jgi:GTP-binding protein